MPFIRLAYSSLCMEMTKEGQALLHQKSIEMTYSLVPNNSRLPHL